MPLFVWLCILHSTLSFILASLHGCLRRIAWYHDKRHIGHQIRLYLIHHLGPGPSNCRVLLILFSTAYISRARRLVDEHQHGRLGPGRSWNSLKTSIVAAFIKIGCMRPLDITRLTLYIALPIQLLGRAIWFYPAFILQYLSAMLTRSPFTISLRNLLKLQSFITSRLALGKHLFLLVISLHNNIKEYSCASVCNVRPRTFNPTLVHL